MRVIIIFLFFLFFSSAIFSQDKKLGKTNLIAGLSAPEMLHFGITHRLANTNLLGINAGIGPSSGSAWTSISLEHRLYLGKNDERAMQKTWFLRQGTTFFPAANSSQHFTFNFTGGKDLPFKKAGNGITIDAGVFYLPESESSSIILVRSLNLWPALRFELYFSL